MPAGVDDAINRVLQVQFTWADNKKGMFEGKLLLQYIGVRENGIVIHKDHFSVISIVVPFIGGKKITRLTKPLARVVI